MNILRKISKILDYEIDQLNLVIKENSFGQVDLMNQIIRHIQKMSGKRIRILLLFLITKLYNSTDRNIYKIAAAIEFIHNATLLHDDVIDNNNGKRRGIKTANKIWNNKVCVLSGDFLLSKSFSLINQVNNYQISELLANTSSAIIEGEISQLIFNASNDVGYEQYISVIEAKTAVLFSASTASAGIFCDVGETKLKKLYNFGKYLGVAFQMIDDGLDYFGTNKILGKPIGTDFKEKKMTLPMILLKKALTKDKKENIWEEVIWNNEKFSRERLRRVISYLDEYSIRNEIQKYSEKYANLAKDSIKFLKGTSSFYDLLIELIDFVLLRTV